MRLHCYYINKELKETIECRPDIEGVENKVINMYPELEFEAFEGFGGAITESAGYVFSLMNENQRETLMEAYFGESGMRYEWVRIPMDSCDFSLGQYEAMSDETDSNLRSFSFERTEKYILPMLDAAEKAAGRKLKIMLTPWSPPSFMKTNNMRIHGGKLKIEYYDFWAEYLCRYIKEFVSRGYSVKRISLQNEPKASQEWDSCVFSDEEEKAFLKCMHRALILHGLEDIGVFIWDHNKERVYERVKIILDSETEKMVHGAACHWYSGDHFENLDFVKQAFPQLKLMISESCIEFSKFDAADGNSNATRLAHELLGDLKHGVSTFIDWNILLDEEGGPNHAGNYCLAPYMYNRTAKELMPQEISRYYRQFAHFISSGDRRIGSSGFTEGIEHVAYLRKDRKVVVILFNRTAVDDKIVLRMNEEIAEISLPANCLLTAIIEQ